MATHYLTYGQVFPVEKARFVQMILDQVKEEDEQDGGVSCDDLTSEELLDCLELESLQHLEMSNEDKVQTIDQSTHDEDMQGALEKNPDISKERSNLLPVRRRSADRNTSLSIVIVFLSSISYTNITYM